MRTVPPHLDYVTTCFERSSRVVNRGRPTLDGSIMSRSSSMKPRARTRQQTLKGFRSRAVERRSVRVDDDATDRDHRHVDAGEQVARHNAGLALRDRKSTRLNSSHLGISY